MESSATRHSRFTPISRRKFIALSSMAAGAMALPGCASSRPRKLTANDKLNVICVGANGKGGSDIEHCSSENILAICDVDDDKAAPTLEKHPKAKFYKDWREMLEREKTADAVVISVPDNQHAAIAAEAIRMRKAVYCQKPLTYSVYEARLLGQLARKYGVVTQMGNQGSATDGLRRAVEVIQSGLLGPVRNVHVWTNRPIWPQGMERPFGADPIPQTLDWNLWLGPAPARPFKKDIYHPFKWRGWQDFGTGALGDMACHTANMPFRALKLGYPTTIEGDSSGINHETYPKSSWLRFRFPARQNLVPVDLWWYDGGRKPDEFLLKRIRQLLDKVPDSGCLVVGDKGFLFSPDDYGARFFVKLAEDEDFIPGPQHEGVAAVPQTLPRNTFEGNSDQKQMSEWIAACKGEGTCYSDFDFASLLTETILLGCVQLRVGKRLHWDGAAMEATNAPEAAQFVKREYREGWTI